MTRRTLLALILLAPVAHAAPVPHPPRLTDESLVGAWAFTWGGTEGGFACFSDDHTYASQVGPDAGALYTGTWHLDRGELVLREWCFWPATGFASGPVTFRVAFDPLRYPALAGATQTGTRVVLTHR